MIFGNANVGIGLSASSQATIRHNTIFGNVNVGIGIQDGSQANFTENTIVGNRDGVFIQQSLGIGTFNNVMRNQQTGITILQASAAITNNTISENGTVGIGIALGPFGPDTQLTNNMVSRNTFSGIQIGLTGQPASGSFAIINGGAISQNGRHGIALVSASQSDIGLTGDILTISDNGGAGIFVNADGSVARIDSSQIVFSNNRGGDCVGRIIDVSPTPCQ